MYVHNTHLALLVASVKTCLIYKDFCLVYEGIEINCFY